MKILDDYSIYISVQVSVRDSANALVRDSVWYSVLSSVQSSVRDSFWNFVRFQVRVSVQDLVETLVQSFTKDQL